MGEECLDLTTVKEFWVVVHHMHCDPGNEFEILHEKQLASDSWETLERGVEVTVKFGNAKVQAHVVFVSDDLSYLKKNFKMITEEYEASFTHILKKHVQIRTRKQYLKVSDQTTQTERNMSLLEENKWLKARCDMLEKLVADLRSEFTTSLAKIDAIGEINQDNLASPVKEEQVSMVLTPSRIQNITVSSKRQTKCMDGDVTYQDDGKMVYFGTNHTGVPKETFDTINWLSYSAATRRLLVSVFSRKILATHSLTGRPSPAFIGFDKGLKRRLDPLKVNDIVEIVSKRCHVSESIVRSAITTKCADENKMYKKRMERDNIENESPPPREAKKAKLSL